MLQAKSAILLKVLLNRFHQGAGEAFLKCLPQDEIKEVVKQTTSSQETAVALSLPREILMRTHYSWLAPLISQMPQYIQGPFIASLSPSQAQGLKKLLKIDSSSYVLSAPIRDFLCLQLWQKWQQKEILPFQYLPSSLLQPLLNLSKSELVELIDILAIHDLSAALRHIVDKKNLKAIYHSLSSRQQGFLRSCLQKREKITAPRLEIDKWGGDPEKFRMLLHQRGLLRLGKSLCGQHPQFLWYIVHTLDTGRGTAVSHHYTEQETPGVTPLLVQQVLAGINFLKQKSEE